MEKCIIQTDSFEDISLNTSSTWWCTLDHDNDAFELYEIVRMPFGCRTAPQKLQRFVNCILRELSLHSLTYSLLTWAQKNTYPFWPSNLNGSMNSAWLSTQRDACMGPPSWIPGMYSGRIGPSPGNGEYQTNWSVSGNLLFGLTRALSGYAQLLPSICQRNILVDRSTNKTTPIN